MNIEELLKGKKPYYIISIIGFITYFQSLFFGFTFFDDNVLILDNLYFLQNLGNIFKTFTLEVFHVLHASAAYYRPFLTISYMLDAQFAGQNPFFYHLVSVVIHIVNACLVYAFLNKIKIRKELSFLFALIFTIHPVLTQAVSWIPGRNDSLLVLFIIPSFIYFINYLESRKGKDLIYHLLFFAGAMFTKESSIFIPPIFFMYAVLAIFDTSGMEDVSDNKRRNYIDKRKDYLGKAIPLIIFGYMFIFMVWFFLRSIALANSPSPYTISSAIKAVFENSPAAFLFVGKIFLPFNLTVLPTLQDSSLILGIISTISLVVLIALYGRKRLWFILFGLIWFGVFLSPSFIRPSSAYVPDFLEHRVYVPIIGMFIILGNLELFRKIDFKKPLHLAIISFFLSLFLVLNLTHNRVFRNRIVFWQDAVKYSPHHPLAHKNMGAMYYLDGQVDKAAPEFEKSLELNPREEMIHNNLGLIYLNRKDYVKAEEYFKKELELYPNYDNAHSNLGLLYYIQGKKEEAKNMWLETIAINPDHKDALRMLAVYYEEVKDQKNAYYFYNEAVKRGVKF
jgi:protein O-mannosyl-transferase